MAEEKLPPIPWQGDNQVSPEGQISLTPRPTEKPSESEEQPQKTSAKFIRLIPLSILTGVALIWAFVGKIPIEVEGRAVLIIPSSDIELQSRAAGKILTINVKEGEEVKVGQLLVTIDLPELQEQLITEQQKLADLKGENLAVTTVENQRTQLKRETLQRQGEAIPREIESLQRQITSNFRQIASNQIQLDANRRQREAYQQRVSQLNDINGLIRAKLDAYKKLTEEGVIASLSAELIRAVEAEQENLNTITTLTAQIEDTQANDEKLSSQIQSLTAQNQDLNAKIEDQNANSEDLKTQNRQLDLENTEAVITRRNLITDKEHDIANLEAKIATESKVFSTYSGRITDIAVNPSQYVTPGTRLATIQVNEAQNQTVGLTFFKPGDADRIQMGMKMEITPDIQIRERYGGILATVTAISPETITPQEVIKLTGSQQLAQVLTDNQPLVQISAKLERDPNTISGYKWTESQGAPQKIPPSATATARVVVEKRSLFSYLLPNLRRLTGIYRN